MRLFFVCVVLCAGASMLLLRTYYHPELFYDVELIERTMLAGSIVGSVGWLAYSVTRKLS